MEEAYAACFCRVWNGHNLGLRDEQVQHNDRVVPRPVGSILLVGRDKWASSPREMQLSVKLLASISRSIHQEEMMANLEGKQGPCGERGSSDSSNS